MAYFEITGLPVGAAEGDFSSTVSLTLEKGRGLTVLSDDGLISSRLADSITGRTGFTGEIILNQKRIDPLGAKKRSVAVIGDTPGIVPGRTVRENLELATADRALNSSEELFLVEEELKEGVLSGLEDIKAGLLDPAQRSVLAVVCKALNAPDLLVIRNLPVPHPMNRRNGVSWNPGLQLDSLIEIKNILRRHRVTWISLLSDQACVQVLSDNVAVFTGDQLLQEGTLRECINAPATRLVADFLAFPAMNYKRGTIERDGPYVMLRVGRYGFSISEYAKRQLAPMEGQDAVIGLRPEDLNLRPYQTGDPSVMNLAKVTRSDHLPGILVVRLDAEGDDWLSIVEPSRAVFTGQLVELRHDPDRVHLFNPVSGVSLLD